MTGPVPEEEVDLSATEAEQPTQHATATPVVQRVSARNKTLPVKFNDYVMYSIKPLVIGDS